MGLFMKRSSFILVLTLILGGLAAAQAADPLPSWNDGAAKQAVTVATLPPFFAQISCGLLSFNNH